jgi:hypothetical protein
MIKIEYHVNPFNSKITLDEEGIAFLKERIIDDLNEWVEAGDTNSEPTPERVEKRLALAVEELSLSHCGDCVCIPCSCFKCWAEGLLGIDTLEGLCKYPAGDLFSAFDYCKHDDIDLAIQNLMKTCDDEKNMEWNPKWNQERAEALKWIKDYKKNKLTIPQYCEIVSK